MATKAFTNIVEAIDGASRIAFGLLTPFLGSKRSRWGATDEEVRRTLPGDDLVPNSKSGFTHAITINAPALDVWPWIVQMGQGRGGFYSYELLENIVGCDIHNADRIIPELQNLKVGDIIKLHPTFPEYPVASIEPCRALVLNQLTDQQTGEVLTPGDRIPPRFVNSTWSWLLEQRDEGTTRLISRFRNDFSPSFGNRMGYASPLIEAISNTMGRKMLLGIKQRAEATARANNE